MQFWCQSIHMISGINIWWDNHAYGVRGVYAVAFPDRGEAWHVEHFYSSVVRHIAWADLLLQRIHILYFH